jgi:hypothetical protein
MGERLNRRFAKWDASNQATMRKQNELAGGTWEEFNERNFPGPAWAYAITALPWIGWIGLLMIARARRARNKAVADESLPRSDT